MARGPAARGANSTAMSINLRIAAICGGVAAAIMMGAVLATRISFPTANPALTPAQPVKIEPTVGRIAESPVVDRYAKARLRRSLIPKSVPQSVPSNQPANAQTPQSVDATNPAANPQPSAPQPPEPPVPPAPQTPRPILW